MDFKDIGKQIKKKRIDKRWRQEDLAEHANISVQYVGMIERGEKFPRLETFVMITNALDASADELLAGVLNNGYAYRMSRYYEKICSLSLKNQKILNEITEIFYRDSQGK